MINADARVGCAAPDVAAGDFARGNIEFCPGGFSPNNQLGIPGADGTTALSKVATVEVFGRGTHLFIR